MLTYIVWGNISYLGMPDIKLKFSRAIKAGNKGEKSMANGTHEGILNAACK